jgi:hypothetical protein
MQRSLMPLLLMTAMHPARELEVTSLQMIPPITGGSRPDSGCLIGDMVPEADASADPACTGYSRSGGLLARPVPPRALMLYPRNPGQATPGTFRKSLPPGTGAGFRILQRSL